MERFIYKKSTDGIHFYRIPESGKILHLGHFPKSGTYSKEFRGEGYTVTNSAKFKKADCVINTLNEMPFQGNYVEITQEQFEEKVRDIIFILGIYEFAKPI